MTPRIVIFTDDPGWHGARLRRAFRHLGVASHYASLAQCRIDLPANRYGLVIPGCGNGLPDGAFVRGVPGGSLEQVVLRLDVLHALQEFGIPVYNPPRAIEKSVDKAMTSLLLRRAGIPTPPTWVTEDAAEARAILMREGAAGHELVVKPLFGSQGKGLQRLAAGMDIPPPEAVNGVWYLQRYIAQHRDAAASWQDWRVFVIGRSAVAAMVRHGRSWINNVAQGARCEAAPAQGALARLAVDATRAVGMDYAGIDILRDAEGRLQVLEVNSIPAWKGLQGATGQDIAGLLAADFVARLAAAPMEAAC